MLFGAAHADDYNVPLPRPVVDAIRSKAIVAVFYIDPEQRILMLEKQGREFRSQASKRKTMTSKEKKEVYLKSLQDEWAFINSQRKNVVALTDDQRNGLSGLLTDPENYFHGLFSMHGDARFGMDVKGSDATFTILFGQSLVSFVSPKDLENALLNERGLDRMLKWTQSVGILERARAKDCWLHDKFIRIEWTREFVSSSLPRVHDFTGCVSRESWRQ